MERNLPVFSPIRPRSWSRVQSTNGGEHERSLNPGDNLSIFCNYEIVNQIFCDYKTIVYLHNLNV